MRRWRRCRHALCAPSGTALHRPNGDVWLASVHRKRPRPSARWFGRPQPLQAASLSAVEHLDDEIAFIPFLNFDHFGHLLTETVGWLGSMLLEKPGAVRSPDRVLLGGLAASGRDQLQRLFPDKTIFTSDVLNGVTGFRRAWIPVPTMVNRDRILPRHLRAVRRYLLTATGSAISPSADPAARLKVYLSRSKLPETARKILEEARLEDQLQACGWTVVHPERISLSMQLAYLQRCSVLLGPLGSAFHLLMALPAHALPQQIVTMGFDQELVRPGPGINFGMQFALQSLNVHHLPVLTCLDPSVPPEQMPRDQNLCFSESIDAIVRRVERLVEADLGVSA